MTRVAFYIQKKLEIKGSLFWKKFRKGKKPWVNLFMTKTLRPAKRFVPKSNNKVFSAISSGLASQKPV